jgi:predicted aldo/keto reductase-like oxidoreductase
LGRTGLEVSVIGYGGLPLHFQSPDVAIEAIHEALNAGVNYFDLDEGGDQFDPQKVYRDGGSKIGQVLKERREDCYLGVKSMRQAYEDVKADVDLALKRIVKGTKREVIDIFHLAFLDTPKKLEVILSKDGGLRALEEAREEGKIDYILGAAHNPRTFKDVITSGRFDAIEFPFNIIEDEYLEEIIPLAKEMDVGTIAMKPIGGGQLQDVAHLSLRWILGHGIDTAIPGMKNKDEVKSNTPLGHRWDPLTSEEMKNLKEVGDEIGKTYCHRCGYCLPCPQNILILGVMDMVLTPSHSLEKRKKMFQEILVEKFKSDPKNCVRCEECVEKCPFNLPIPDMMEKAVKMFG